MSQSQDIINHFFQLIVSINKKDNGLDLLSFSFYDYYLIIFDSMSKIRQYHYNLAEFQMAVNSL